ncbi:MAG: ATP-binding protein [Planctomycetaceae bacterium]|nr:ATP-binding protein [Planctomycetaceae bacterium]
MQLNFSITPSIPEFVPQLTSSEREIALIEALRESEARSRAFFELASDAIILVENQQIVACNHKTLELFQAKSPEELLGLHPWDISPEFQEDGLSSKEKVIQLINRCRNETPEPFEWIARRLNGSEFYSSVSLCLIPHAKKEVHLASIRDISEQKLISEAIENHKAYLQVLAEMRRFFYGHNEKEIVASFLEIVTSGFHFAKTWYGEYLFNVIRPSIHSGPKAGLVDGDKFPVADPVNHPNPDESVFPMASAICEKNCCLINHLQTSSCFKKWQHLAETGNFNALAALPFEVNGKIEGGFVFYSESQQINENVLEYLQSGLRELSRIISERRLWEEQKRVLKFAKEKAEMAVKAKTHFLANMSHEIRTPMTAILGYTEILADSELSKNKLEESAHIIRNNAKYLLHILNDILDYSKIEAEMLKVEIKPFRLDKLLAEMESLFRAVTAEKNLSFKITNTTAFPNEILTDPIRMKQVLLNLIGNAVKFTSQGGIHVNISWAGNTNIGFGQLRIDISDTGVGISEDSLEKIFTPFEQQDNSTTRKYGGTGLGLAISRRLMRLLCGNLTVKSTQGKGSCFSIFLPQYTSSETVWSQSLQLGLKENTSTKPELRENISSALAGRRVLLVEDSKDNQRLFSLILRKSGAEVLLADNGRQAVEMVEEIMLRENSFDLILMDMQMPVMDGYTATDLIRKMGYEKPIIALTAHAMSEERIKCIAAGCNDFVTKPILRDALITAVLSNLRDENETDSTPDSPPELC